MAELCYSALDIAAIISSKCVGCQAESAYIDLIWKEENAFLNPLYRSDQRRFILDVRYWLNYLYDKPTLDAEFPAIQKDMEHTNGIMQAEAYMNDFSNLDLFFKNTRISILYIGPKKYVRIKLRTLLRQYGYQRRSALLVCHINHCLDYYHLSIALRGGMPCTIEAAGLDQMITFRVV